MVRVSQLLSLIVSMIKKKKLKKIEKLGLCGASISKTSEIKIEKSKMSLT